MSHLWMLFPGLSQRHLSADFLGSRISLYEAQRHKWLTAHAGLVRKYSHFINLIIWCFTQQIFVECLLQARHWVLDPQPEPTAASIAPAASAWGQRSRPGLGRLARLFHGLGCAPHAGRSAHSEVQFFNLYKESKVPCRNWELSPVSRPCGITGEWLLFVLVVTGPRWVRLAFLSIKVTCSFNNLVVILLLFILSCEVICLVATLKPSKKPQR